MTPHIKSEEHDIAELVIMPGDPLRARYIAEKYLTDYKLVNDVRLALAYTGYYKNKRVTVMASGMGMPSMAIYSYELFKEYGVKKIIRVGSCGSYHKEIKVNDCILVEKAYTLSNFAYQYNGVNINLVRSSNFLNQKIIEEANRKNLEIKIGVINTSDLFYNIFENPEIKKNYCLGVEMECFALFFMAKTLSCEASAILTVSDNLVTKEELTSEEREKTFDKAITLALESIR